MASTTASTRNYLSSSSTFHVRILLFMKFDSFARTIKTNRNGKENKREPRSESEGLSPSPRIQQSVASSCAAQRNFRRRHLALSSGENIQSCAAQHNFRRRYFAPSSGENIQSCAAQHNFRRRYFAPSSGENIKSCAAQHKFRRRPLAPSAGKISTAVRHSITSGFPTAAI